MPNEIKPNYHAKEQKKKFDDFFKMLDRYDDGVLDQAEFAQKVNRIFGGKELRLINKSIKKYGN